VPPARSSRTLAGQFGRPETVELGSLEVGHFHGLMHEGDGRIAYLYEAAIPEHRPPTRVRELDEIAASAFA
jgi:hypothetical protein